MSGATRELVRAGQPVASSMWGRADQEDEEVVVVVVVVAMPTGWGWGFVMTFNVQDRADLAVDASFSTWDFKDNVVAAALLREATPARDNRVPRMP